MKLVSRFKQSVNHRYVVANSFLIFSFVVLTTTKLIVLSRLLNHLGRMGWGLRLIKLPLTLQCCLKATAQFCWQNTILKTFFLPTHEIFTNPSGFFDQARMCMVLMIIWWTSRRKLSWKIGRAKGRGREEREPRGQLLWVGHRFRKRWSSVDNFRKNSPRLTHSKSPPAPVILSNTKYSH